MKKLLVGLVAVACAVGCQQSPESYSQDISSEIPKPRSNGPDFGAYERTAPTPGSNPAGQAPKHLKKGG